MQWKEFTDRLDPVARDRLLNTLQEARLFGGLPARADDRSDVESIVACIDRAIDALAAARILLDAPAEPQPWADPIYRASRAHHADSAIRMSPAQLSTVRRAVRERHAARQGVAVASR